MNSIERVTMKAHSKDQRTIGLVGLGRVSKRLVELLTPFACPLLAVDPVPDEWFAERHGIRFVEQATGLRFGGDRNPLLVGRELCDQRMLGGEHAIGGSEERVGPGSVDADHLAAVVAAHLVEQLGVGEGGTLRGQVIAAMGRVRIEVFLGKAHRRQIFAGGASRQYRV